MQILKTLFTIVACAALGIAAGFGIFYLSHREKPTTTDQVAATPSPTKQVQSNVSTPSSSANREKSLENVTIKLQVPENIVVEEKVLSGYPTSFDTAQLNFLTINNVSATRSTSTLYVLQGSSGLSTQKTKLLRAAVNKTATRTFSLRTSNGEEILKKEYGSSGSTTLTTYEITTESSVVLLVLDPEDTIMSESAAETLMKSLTITEDSESPTPVTTNSPLL